MPGVSAGDLALAGGTLYASEVDPLNGNDMLVNVTTKTVIGDFNLGSARFQALFGLAFTGGNMYAVDGQNVYSVDLGTAALTFLSNYSGSGNLGNAFGAAVVGESAAPGPVPGTGLAGFALLVLAGVATRARGFFAR